MIQIDNLKKQYGKKQVLNGVEFEVLSGEVYGLVGKNGAGKTTLMNIISGITKASGGRCIIDGEVSAEHALEDGSIGYLPDLPTFYDYLSVSEYLGFLDTNAGVKKENTAVRSEELIRAFDIDPNTRIKTLSRGNRQKLGIISAVMGTPKVLLLDEPTSALDPVGRRDVMRLINELKKSGMTIVLSTHILSDLEIVCDKIGFLNSGKIAREVRMKTAEAVSKGYRVHFREEDVDVIALKNIFYEYTINTVGGAIEIHSEDIADQNDFFQRLSLLSCTVERVERLETVNLESIMEEVLSQ